MKYRAFALLALASVISPFAVAATPTSGLLITRVNSQQWEVRLISSGSNSERFSGTFESDVAFSKVTPVGIEGSDSVRLSNATTLETSVAAWSGHTDGVDFTVSGDAALCLRDTGSTGVNIYLGESLDNAVAVTAPVALTSADACGGVSPPPSGGGGGGRKFHPGHYIALMRNGSSEKIMSQSMKPGVVGFVKRYTWREVEPSKGQYNFAGVKADLAWAQANGMRMIIMFEDRTFSLEKAGPQYLDQYEQRTASGGYCLERWQPAVVSAWINMIRAFGAQFDKHPNLEGIATQETSLGFSSAVMKAAGYTPEKYRDSYISILSAAAAALPTSRVFWFMNFFNGNQNYIASIASAVAPKGVLMGGPDVWPDNKGLATRTYPFYTQFKGKMPLFGQVEPLCYDEPHMTSGLPNEVLDHDGAVQLRAHQDARELYVLGARDGTPGAGRV